LANTRLPAGEPRPYAVIKIYKIDSEIYTGGEISDYVISIEFYTTQGLFASGIQTTIDKAITLMSNFTIDNANTIMCLPIDGDDEVADEMDVSSDVLVNSQSWHLKLFEPNRLTRGVK